MAKDNIVYIRVKDHLAIKELYTRKAECKNDEITFRTYFPPQYYARFLALNQICKDKRASNPDLKTQLRIGLKDIDIMTKLKSSKEPFKMMKLCDFIGQENIPDFDCTIKWSQQTDKPPRRRLKSRNEMDEDPASGQTQTEEHPLRRQRSVGVQDITGNKRTKTTALIVVDDMGDF